MDTTDRRTHEVAHRTPPRPRRWLTPAVVGLCFLGVPIAVGVAHAGEGWIVTALPVFLAYMWWSDTLAPRRLMRRAAVELGWQPPIQEGFERGALRGDAHLALGNGGYAHDLIEGPDGAQAFWIGNDSTSYTIVVRPLARESPYLATTPRRRLSRTAAPQAGRTIRLGDPAFDERYRTMTESPEFARAFLTPKVRALIAEHPSYCLRIDGDRAIAFRYSHANAAVVTGLLEFLDRVLDTAPAAAWDSEGTTPAEPPARWQLYQ